MNDTTATPARVPIGKLAWGLALLLLGALTFVDVLDLINFRDLWRFWPVFLIVVGISSEIDALRMRTPGSGSLVAAIGVWLLIANTGFLGLTYRTAVPVAVAIVGLGIIVHALVDDPNAKKEKQQ